MAFALDFGNLNTTITKVMKGGVDVILNEASKRQNPTLVSFGGNERYIGEAATSQIRTNMDNTVTQVKRLLGRKFSEPGIAEELAVHLNYKLVQLKNDDIGIEVFYNNETRILTPTQVLAAYFTKMKSIIQSSTPGVSSPDVVISVPAFYTDAQRHAVRDAAAIAGLNCLRTLNDATAAALSFGIYKSRKLEFPEGVETKVLFLDMGHAHFSATVVGFTNTSLRVLSSVSDDTIGARELDVLIARSFAEDFKAKTGLDAWGNRKSRVKLMVAAEKAKTAVTPYGVNQAPVSIECLVGESDFSATFTVEKMEELCGAQMVRLQSVIKRAMGGAGVSTVSELNTVELVGGGMRPRIVKRRAAEALGLPLNEETGHGLSSSMNLDEAISRGCALACAIMSPSFKVPFTFEIIDSVPFTINLTWDAAATGAAPPTAADGGMDVEEDGEGASATSNAATPCLTLFPAGTRSPALKRVGFRVANSSIEITAEYAADANNAAGLPVGHPRVIGKYRVTDVPTDAVEEGAPKIRCEFRHDIHGCVDLVNAHVMKEIRVEATQQQQQQQQPEAAATAPAPAEGAPAAADAAAAPATENGAAPAPTAAAETAAAAPATKKRFRKLDVPFRVESSARMTESSLKEAYTAEQVMAAQDAEIHATQDLRNSLEASIYSSRSALEEALSAFAAADEKDALQSTLTAMEEWLYGDGFEADGKTYQAKLKELSGAMGRIQTRRVESETRYGAVQDLIKLIDDFRGVMANREGKHAHLTETERDTLRSATSEVEQWLKAKQEEQAKLERFQDPVLRVADVKERQTRLSKELGPIAKRPPPAPEARAASPPAASAPAAAPAEAAAPEGSSSSPAPGADAPAAAAPATMDVEA